jgi:Phosphatidylglycerophosphatase A and related proteins
MKSAKMENLRTWYGLLATFFGVGNFTGMPGTMGTLAAFLLLVAFGGIPPVVLAATIIVGTVASDRYAKAHGKEDPGEVVIDEVAGYWTAMYGLDPGYALSAFFLFRVLDITKPFPIHYMERLPGGVGIMADDIVGGVLTNALMRFVAWLFFSGGLELLYRYFGVGG